LAGSRSAGPSAAPPAATPSPTSAAGSGDDSGPGASRSGGAALAATGPGAPGVASRGREPASWSDAPPPPDTAPSWASPLEQAKAAVAVETEVVATERVVD